MKLKESISLIPVGPVEQTILEYIQQKLSTILNTEVFIRPMHILPSGIFDTRRNQYDIRAVLKLLHDFEDTSGYKIGYINEDCYEDGSEYVLGESVLKGEELVIALPRLNLIDGNTDRTIFLNRVLKETLHELGHSLGLLHCPHGYCVMHNSATLHRKEVDLANPYCGRCEELLIQSDSTF
ncbi:hypothetical protein QA601_08915 [Chitinispirillales bacterium ANBcel5]|uniref:hypothetical protein n=1 Tax=Cellulosispirillum alkaliphilum TaxID=3039283 RepID=UPI002A4E5086|nr:hypothetical protein [Chitinispirillales bacterium ANBcel5]